MDIEKMKQWVELAKQFQQGPFWGDLLETGNTKKMMEQFTKPSVKPSTNKPLTAAFPPADIFKNNHEYIMVLDLPGVRKEDVEISIADYSLHIKGIVNRSYPELVNIQTERYIGEFERTISLPEMVVPGENISARFDNGILEIRILRSHRPKEIIKID